MIPLNPIKKPFYENGVLQKVNINKCKLKQIPNLDYAHRLLIDCEGAHSRRAT